VVVIVAVILAGCASGVTTPGPNDGASLDFDAKATIVVDDTDITPQLTPVHVGDAITVTNRGSRDHGLTSKTIDTGTLHPGESTVVYFTAEGRIDAYDRDTPDHKLEIDVSSGTT
jgi:plastocyanin